MVESVVQSRAEIVVDSTEKSKIRVLHVDDELDLLKVAKQCLELQGPFHVDSASSVEEALEKMKKEMYDAVVSDYVMPGKDGSDFLKELRDAGNDIPFIMFTGKSKEEIAIRALNLGADGYFSKAGSPVTVYGELAHSICQIVESQKTKEALRTSESYLRAILDSMFTGLIVIDEKTHKIFDANFHALETIAAPRENVIGKTCHRFICPAEEGKCPITDLGQTVDRSERVLLRADGQRIPILKTVTTMIRRGRKYIIESFVDITERKRGEEALKDSERKYREFADSLPEIAFEVDEKGNVTFFNRRAFEILGYSQEDFRSLNIFQFLIPKDQVRVKENIQKILNGEKSRGHEYTLLRKDGSTFPALAFTNRIVSEDGKGGLRGVIIDISEQKNTEERLRESEEKFRNLAEQSPNMIFINQKGRVTYANKEAEDAMGYKKEEFYSPNFNFLDLVAQESKELVQSAFSGHMKGEDVAPYEYRLATKEGKIIDAILTTKLITYEGETAILGTVIDITERKKAELELQESEAKYRMLVEQLPLAIYTISAEDAKITSLNPVFEKITGWKRSEWIGKSFEKLIHPDDLPLALEAFQKAIHGETMPPYELRVLSNSGEYLVGEFTSGPQTEKGKIVGKFGMVRDITERKKAEWAIFESQQKFEGLFMANPEAAVYLGPDFCILSINPRFEDLFGYNLAEIRGRHIDDVIVPDGKIEETKVQDEKASQGYVYYNAVRRRKDGSLVPVSVSAAPITVGGKITGYVDVYRDITERKYHEERLSALNTYSRNLNMAQSMKEIYSLTLDAMQKVLGFEYADFFMIKESVLSIVDQRGYPKPFPLELPLDGSKKGISIKVAKTGNSVIVQDVRNDIDFVEGLPNILSELAVPIKIGQKTFGVLNVESKKLDAFDEKDQQLLEILASHAATAISNLEYAKNLEAYAQEIRESQQKFELLFMANPEAAVHVGPDLLILNVNHRFEMLFGYRLDEIKGKNINDVVVPKDKIDEAQMLDQRAEQDKHVSQATVRKRKDGSLVPVFVSAAPITVEDRFLGYVAVYKDISELKNTEKKLEIMNEKLRVTGGLTRHDVRNKLSTVAGNVYLLKKRLADNSDMLDKLKAIESAVQQTVRIFDFAKAYEMLGVEELSYVDVAKTLDEAVSLFPGSINMKVVNECRGLAVLADPLLRQLFYNLIDNSLRYGQKTTRIRVHYEETGQDNLRLVYEDDGVGIPSAEKPKLFKEGYSTGGSTGYGLYLVSKIVEVYGWTIQETGTHGKGVQFTIAIPKVNRDGKESVCVSEV